MFVILLSYIKPLEIVDQYLAEHSNFLDECYRKNYFFVSGRKIPRTGGVILSQLTDRNELEAVIKNDPFNVHQIADYDIIEFSPTKYNPDFSGFIMDRPK
jgi:uncharacterized protein YciI